VEVIMSTLSPYLRSLLTIVSNGGSTPSLPEIAAQLKQQGWTGKNVQEPAIRQGLSELAVLTARGEAK